ENRRDRYTRHHPCPPDLQGPEECQSFSTQQNFLMTSHLGKIFVTELDNKLEERMTENCSVRILSSSVWNEVSEEEKLLPGSFMLQDVSSGGPLLRANAFLAKQRGNQTGSTPTEGSC